MDSQLSFRKAEMNDMPAIRELVTSAVRHLQAHGNMQWDERYPLDCDFIPDIETDTQWLGFIDEELAVIYALNMTHDAQYDAVTWPHEGEPYTVLHRFIVHPSFQGQGIAKAALAHIIEELQAQGIRNIRLDTYRHNAASQHLYRGFGFVDVGIAYFRDKVFDLMELHLENA